MKKPKRKWAMVRRRRSKLVRVTVRTHEMLQELAELGADGPNASMAAQLHLAVETRYRVMIGE